MEAPETVVDEATWNRWMTSTAAPTKYGQYGLVAQIVSGEEHQTEDLVVKLFGKRPLSRDGAEVIMNEEVAIMKELQTREVPFRGTLEASTPEWRLRTGEKCPAIVMRRAGSATAAEMFSDPKCKEETKLDLLFQSLVIAILWGAKNVAHNDIKLANIMVDEGAASLIDFGGVTFGEPGGRPDFPKQCNTEGLDVITMAEHLNNITGPEPTWIQQDAFLSNAYMVGATFTPKGTHRLQGVPKVQTGGGVSVRERVCQQLMVNDITKRFSAEDWLLDPDFQAWFNDPGKAINFKASHKGMIESIKPYKDALDTSAKIAEMSKEGVQKCLEEARKECSEAEALLAVFRHQIVDLESKHAATMAKLKRQCAEANTKRTRALHTKNWAAQAMERAQEAGVEEAGAAAGVMAGGGEAPDHGQQQQEQQQQQQQQATPAAGASATPSPTPMDAGKETASPEKRMMAESTQEEPFKRRRMGEEEKEAAFSPAPTSNGASGSGSGVELPSSGGGVSAGSGADGGAAGSGGDCDERREAKGGRAKWASHSSRASGGVQTRSMKLEQEEAQAGVQTRSMKRRREGARSGSTGARERTPERGTKRGCGSMRQAQVSKKGRLAADAIALRKRRCAATAEGGTEHTAKRARRSAAEGPVPRASAGASASSVEAGASGAGSRASEGVQGRGAPIGDEAQSGDEETVSRAGGEGTGGHRGQGPALSAQPILEAEQQEEEPREQDAAADNAIHGYTGKGKGRAGDGARGGGGGAAGGGSGS